MRKRRNIYIPAKHPVNIAHHDNRTLGQHVADTFSAVLGSWRFIIIQSVVLACWLVANVLALINHWDPYPFVLLNLCLSFQAAYAMPIVMMSQNRMAVRDRAIAELDYETNQKAKQIVEELMIVLQHVDRLTGEVHGHLLATDADNLQSPPPVSSPLR